jgi:pilus assembly protein Flp/PilA
MSEREQWNLIVGYIQARLSPVVRTERGASLVEYALVVALIAVVCIGAVTFIGRNANTKLSSAGGSLR